MQILTNMGRYDWATWLIGLMRAFNMGLGGAITGVLGPMATDSDHFNLGPSGLKHTLTSMAIGFIVSAVFQLGLFLNTHGAPEKTP
jgi:hypothetical protein